MALFPCLLLCLLTFSLVTSTEMKMHEWGNNNSDIGLIFSLIPFFSDDGSHKFDRQNGGI